MRKNLVRAALLGFVFLTSSCTVNIGSNEDKVAPNMNSAETLAARDLPELTSLWDAKDHKTNAARLCLAMREMLSETGMETSSVDIAKAQVAYLDVSPRKVLEDGKWEEINRLVTFKQDDAFDKINGKSWSERDISSVISEPEYEQLKAEVQFEASVECGQLGVELDFG